MEIIKTIYVICEGKSEETYLILLNRYLNQKEYCFTFSPIRCSQKNGHLAHLKKRWRDCQRHNRRTFSRWEQKKNIFFLVDWDLFERNENNCRALYFQEKDSLPPFFFNYQNFEDFLSLHLPSDQATRWCNTCTTRQHFRTPMHASQYTPLFSQLVPGYKKGTLPIEFDMCDALKNLKVNHTNSRLHQCKLNLTSYAENDFVDYLLKLLFS